jgi:hypothetical protein
LFTPSTQTQAAEATLTLTGKPEIVYNSSTDACEPIDVPDINPRAYRDASGNVVLFALHFVNRVLRGPDLAHVKIDCHVVLDSPLDPEPSHYADRNYIAATWTEDGRNVSALVHHEYHADQHGRCRVTESLGCWYNTILAFRSQDAGLNFMKVQPPVVAAAPFRQEVEQGRHRGFFAPSNIVSDGTYEYFFAATTGWSGQDFGPCLFRSATPWDSGSWRVFDGKSFSIRYKDPYEEKQVSIQSCRPIQPFVFPVGAVVRERKSGLWIAVLQAARNESTFPVDGFYYVSATDLLHWSSPKLLLAGKTLYSDLCKAGASIIAYPSLLDETSQRRNFDDVGDVAYLYFTLITVEKCQTRERLLVREKISIEIKPHKQP